VSTEAVRRRGSGRPPGHCSGRANSTRRATQALDFYRVGARVHLDRVVGPAEAATPAGGAVETLFAEGKSAWVRASVCPQWPRTNGQVRAGATDERR